MMTSTELILWSAARLLRLLRQATLPTDTNSICWFSSATTLLYYSYLDSGKGEESFDAMVSNDTPEAAQAGLGGPGWTWLDPHGPGEHFLDS